MDVEAAQALMAEAGYADGGFDLSMAYQGTSPEETAAMQIMQAGAAQLGITIRPDGHRVARQSSGLLLARDGAGCGHGVDVPLAARSGSVFR